MRTFKEYLTVTDLGSARDVRPLDQNFSILMKFVFEKNGQIVGWRPLRGSQPRLWEIIDPPLFKMYVLVSVVFRSGSGTSHKGVTNHELCTWSASPPDWTISDHDLAANRLFFGRTHRYPLNYEELFFWTKSQMWTRNSKDLVFFVNRYLVSFVSFNYDIQYLAMYG